MDLSSVTVVIPAYKPDAKLIATLTGLTQAGFTDILVVNDGSGPDFDQIFRQVEAIPHCTLLLHPENRGKGAALKTAFRFFLQERPHQRGMVAADADGQHLVGDIAAVSQKMLEGGHIVLGVRDFTAAQVPPKNRMGNQLTVGVFRLFFGMKVSDTQTGLRAFPRECLEDMAAVPGDRYEYETQMLFLMSRNKLPFDQVGISTVYLEDNRSSHFRVVHDSLRIYALIIKYLLSSVSAALIDALAFFLLKSVMVFDRLPVPSTWPAALLARVLSSLCNFFLNAKVVFGGKPSGRAMARYYALAVVQILISTTLVHLAELAFSVSAPILSTLIKVLVDTALFFFSFRIQHNWVFNSGTQPIQPDVKGTEPIEK